MSELIKHQIIEHEGKPAFAIVPYDEFLRVSKLVAGEKDLSDVYIPQEVAEANIMHDIPLLRAWRDHLGLTQQEVANRAGMSQPAYAKLERPDANPRRNTLAKVAKAMGLVVDQIF